MELYLNDKLEKITYEIDDTPIADSVLILAHGAGAGMHHPFLQKLAHLVCDKGTSVVRFNFPYMEKGRKAPGSPNDAIFTWRQMIGEVKNIFRGKRVFVSGKSYGGRMVSHLLSEMNDLGVEGILYYGFPLHAPGRDSKDRAAHLGQIKIPQLFIQGTNDKLANFEMMTEVVDELNNAKMIAIEQGDHSFNTPKSVASKEETMERLATISTDWISGVYSIDN